MDFTASSLFFHMLAGTRVSSKPHLDLVNLPLVAEQIAAHHGETASQKEVCIMVDVAPDVLVIGDLVELRRALAQIVADALENTPPGGRVIIAGETSNGSVTLTISDDGPCTTAPHIWERLYGNTRSGPGAGIGQRVVEEVIKSHGGRSDVARQAKKGSRFVLQLPVRG
ncbi:MAG: hypothetical protein JWL90_2955 [Chthoniobacteraceae bacterium]|nr:hypothetical protein [Chthoniobacteraceae bacterium]